MTTSNTYIRFETPFFWNGKSVSPKERKDDRRNDKRSLLSAEACEACRTFAFKSLIKSSTAVAITGFVVTYFTIFTKCGDDDDEWRIKVDTWSVNVIEDASPEPDVED